MRVGYSVSRPHGLTFYFHPSEEGRRYACRSEEALRFAIDRGASPTVNYFPATRETQSASAEVDENLLVEAGVLIRLR